jgi:hypothetical protein
MSLPAVRLLDRVVITCVMLWSALICRLESLAELPIYLLFGALCGVVSASFSFSTRIATGVCMFHLGVNFAWHPETLCLVQLK